MPPGDVTCREAFLQQFRKVDAARPQGLKKNYLFNLPNVNRGLWFPSLETLGGTACRSAGNIGRWMRNLR